MGKGQKGCDRLMARRPEGQLDKNISISAKWQMKICVDGIHMKLYERLEVILDCYHNTSPLNKKRMVSGIVL